MIIKRLSTFISSHLLNNKQDTLLLNKTMMHGAIRPENSPELPLISAEVAKLKIKRGAKIIDVRSEEEYQEEHLSDSMLIPLSNLPKYIHLLDKETEYLILCALGLRAATATRILRKAGINASCIKDGLNKWPFETVERQELELILFDFCPFAQRAVITLKEAGVHHKLTYLDPDNLPDWFASVSPFGKVPILRVNNETTIFESSVINELINNLSSKQMLPSNPVELGLCRSWIEFSSTLLSQLTGMICAKNAVDFMVIHTNFLENLQRLEEHLTSQGRFFTGKNVLSLVDSSYAPLFMRMAYLNQYFDLYTKKDIPMIQHWATDLLSSGSVIHSVPSDFSSIYYDFIQRRGKDAYLLNEVLLPKLKKVA